MKTYSKGGRGRKQCPECNEFVGVRTSECECGYEFKSKGKTTFSKSSDSETDSSSSSSSSSSGPVCKYSLRAKQDAAAYGWSGMVITTPNKECPVKLKQYDEESVHRWCEAVIATKIQTDRAFMCSHALKYYLNEFFDLISLMNKGDSEERRNHKAVCGYIDSYFGESVATGSIPQAPKVEHRKEKKVDALHFDDDILDEEYNRKVSKPTTSEPAELGKTMKEAKRDEEDIEL